MTVKSLLRGLVAVAAIAVTGGIAVEPLSMPAAVAPARAGVAPADARKVAAAGLVEPWSETRILAATAVGRLASVAVDEGERVTVGQAIAEIDNADLKASLAAAEQTVVLRENELLRLNDGAREQERRVAEAALHQAEATLRLAHATYERQGQLGGRGVVSEQALDQARADLDVAQARRALQTAQLDLLIAPPRSEDVAIAEANLAVARAHVDEVAANLEKTIIRSPIDGVVLRRYRNTGEAVTTLPPTPVLAVGDISRLRVRADVDEADVDRVAVGEGAWIAADAYGARRFHGTVIRVGEQLGRKNIRTDQPTERLDERVLEVLIELDPGARLPVGLRVDVEFDAPVAAAAEPGTG